MDKNKLCEKDLMMLSQRSLIFKDTKTKDWAVIDYSIPSSDPEHEFHPNGKTFSFTLDDDYFVGLRANHFIIIFGHLFRDYADCAALVIANHKGTLKTRLIFRN